MYADRGQSLIERKKQQWAREREELAGLNVPWGNGEAQFVSRTRNAIKLQNNSGDSLLRKEPNSRRQSLPPLYRNQNNAPFAHGDKFEKEMGGETSGYGSDNANNSPEHYRQGVWNNALGYESSSSGREDRLKWGDRGVHVGKFWEPKEMDNLSKASDTPGWVKRGLEGDTELVVSNSSPAESPEQDFGDRPGTSSTTSQMRCFIRGQNVPVEPTELAERERRRQLALAHQEAIRQQLEEREQKRKEERERRIREEYEEELRIQREKEVERQRKEQEQKAMREKLERERKRKEALQEAIELAEKQAKQEKIKQKALKQNNVNMKENLILIDKEKFKPIKNNEENDSENVKVAHAHVEADNGNRGRCDNNERVKNNLNKLNSNYNCINPESAKVVNVNNNGIDQVEIKDVNAKEANNNVNNNYRVTNVPPLHLPQSNQQPDLALVLQTPYETFQNMQFAVLMPTAGGGGGNGTAAALPIAVPLTIATDRSGASTMENRVLTPSQYRNKKFCDTSTQTEPGDFHKHEIADNRDKYVREKLSSLEIGYDNRGRKERRMQTRENTGERPKWGVNRPPTRYLKQSEKDPVYQRRKLRQKMRQVKVYVDKNAIYSPHSSDDSQTASPRVYRKAVYPEKRHCRALWRKNEQLFAQNVRVYQTEIVPLESDKDQIYYKSKSCRHCCCRCREDKHVDILKIQHSSPRECVRYKDEAQQRLPDCTTNNNSMDSSSEIFAIQNELCVKQEELWENSPRSPSLSSLRRNSEN